MNQISIIGAFGKLTCGEHAELLDHLRKRFDADTKSRLSVEEVAVFDARMDEYRRDPAGSFGTEAV